MKSRAAKIARFAPRQIATVNAAVKVNPGACISRRAANLSSRKKASKNDRNDDMTGNTVTSVSMFPNFQPVKPCQTDRMYNPAPFPEERVEVLHAFIREHPLAAIVSWGESGLEATHVPVVLHPDLGARGTMRCHFARANGQWKTIQSSPAILAIFQGPQHYITPSWYPSKKEHGKVVPTWNYTAVHVRGKAKTFEGRDDLIAHVTALTAQNEQDLEEPWSVSDAPRDYIEALTKAIVGIEISIETIEGKWKASQNRPVADRMGVVEGLTALGTPQGLEMARIVRERGLK
jgi:transcriptional regulator